MYYFIMAEWQHEIFIIVIHQAEGKLILAELPGYRIQFKIIQGIVHPAHHPFHAKSKTITNCGFGDTRPIGGFFSYRLYIRKIPVYGLIEVFDKCNGFEITITAM